MVKNRFRVFKVPLNQKADRFEKRSETEEMGRVIAACLVLHNILIDLQDRTDVIAEELLHRPEDLVEQLGGFGIPPCDSNQKRDQIKEYLFANKASIKSIYF